MKIFRQITISLFIALISFVSLTQIYSYFANSFFSPTFSYLKVSYHDEINDYFNGKIVKLNEILDEKSFYDNPNMYAPEFITRENYDELCGLDNVSTYCVSMGALNIYMTYVDNLSELLGQVEIDDEGGAVQISDVYNDIYERNDSINEEIEKSRAVLEATVSAYNEYRLAKPMHTEYEQMIDNLIKYRYALKFVARLSEKLPGKFIDATSAYCE